MLLKALAKEPDDRFQTAADFATALQRARDETMSVAEPERDRSPGVTADSPAAAGPTPQPHREKPRRRWFLWLGAAALLALVIFGIMLVGGPDTPAQPGGIGHYDRETFEAISEFTDVLGSVIYTAPDETLWLGSYKGGLWSFDGDQLRYFGEEDGLPYGRITTVSVSRNDYPEFYDSPPGQSGSGVSTISASCSKRVLSRYKVSGQKSCPFCH